jgi:hypothetical protein
MNYWNKMAFGLALVAGLCGGAWAQDRGHDDKDKARDSHQWRDRDHDRDHEGDRDRDRWRDRRDGYYRNRNWGYYPNGNYGYYPNGTWGRGGYGSNYGHQAGYNEGLRWGRYDRSLNRSYRAGNYKVYKNGDQAYRSGFVAGYNAGFGRGW